MTDTSGAGSAGTPLASAPQAFVRKASGVVRAWSPLDGFIYNVLAINPVIMIGFTYYSASVLFPHGSVAWAIVFTGILCIAEGFCYAVLVSLMPRSGGDYVFQSRVFGGAVGTLFSFAAIVLGQVISLSFITFTAVTMVFSPWLTLLGERWNQSWMFSLGTWLSTHNGYAVVAVIVIVWGAVINITGMRVYALVQRWFFWPGVALLAMVMLILAFTSHAEFVATFNQYMLHNAGISNGYVHIIAQAKAAGFQPTAASWLNSTTGMMPIMSLSLMFLVWGVAQGGEIRSGNSLKAQVLQMPGAVSAVTISGAILAWLLVSRLGSGFVTAAGYLYMSAPDKYNIPVSPLFGSFVAIIANNTWLILGIALLFNFWFWMWYPNAMVASSRVILAMTIDRMLPAWFGRVNHRTATPVNAILFVALIGLVFGLLTAYTNFSAYFLSIIVPSIICFGVTCLVAATLPWRRPQLYKESPAAALKVFGIPLVTIAGVVFVGFAAWTTYACLTDSRYGLNARGPLLLVLGTFVLSAVIYIAARYARRKQGIDVNQAYKQIPIE